MPFSQGIAWLVQSFSLMRLQAGRLLLIAVFMQMILGLTQVPLIGFLVIISVPGLSGGSSCSRSPHALRARCRYAKASALCLEPCPCRP